MGGNHEKSYQMIENALLLIQRELGHIVKISSIYKTAAWGPIVQPDFLNIAIMLHSQLPPLVLLKKMLGIETRLGRKRTVKYGPRTIDIDLLFYGNEIINNKILTVPHAQIENRRFVLLPCNEIIPGFRHPVSGRNIHTLLLACKDSLEVKKWQK